jgi:hypothetical protein
VETLTRSSIGAKVFSCGSAPGTPNVSRAVFYLHQNMQHNHLTWEETG